MVDLKHKIPENFIAEEIRCGYKVTQQMKEVWAVQLDLFAEFDRVCRKYGIKYVASGGTLLGAVRHHGYILNIINYVRSHQWNLSIPISSR